MTEAESRKSVADKSIERSWARVYLTAATAEVLAVAKFREEPDPVQVQRVGPDAPLHDVRHVLHMYEPGSSLFGDDAVLKPSAEKLDSAGVRTVLERDGITGFDLDFSVSGWLFMTAAAVETYADRTGPMGFAHDGAMPSQHDRPVHLRTARIVLPVHAIAAIRFYD